MNSSQVVLYVASDSTMVTRFLEESFKNKYKVIHSPLDCRGHTTGPQPQSDSVKSIMTDLNILLACDNFVLTKKAL